MVIQTLSFCETPLAATKYMLQRDSGEKAVRTFISDVVKPFGEELDILVDRRIDLLKQVVRKYKNPSFDITKCLNVMFADEPGIDGGGLTREYFHILMESLSTPSDGELALFEGQAGHLIPSHNYDFVSGGLFVLVGKMILYVILNKCKGIPGIAPAVVSYLVSGNVMLQSRRCH